MNKTSRLVANAIRHIKPVSGDDKFLKGIRKGIELSADALCDALAREYPAFDTVQFLRCCGVPPRSAVNRPPIRPHS